MISTIVTCWNLKLKNKKLLCFTDFDQDIEFEDKKYICGGYFTPSSIFSSNELAQDNFSISGIIDGDIFSHEAFIRGDFNRSFLEIFTLDLKNLDKPKNILKTGWLGEIKYNQNSFESEVSTLSAKTNNIIGKCYSNSCRAEFADQFCKKNKADFSFSGAITEIITNNIFIDENRSEPNDYFTKGVIKFLSGGGKDASYNILAFENKKIILESAINLRIEIGDLYLITAGCDKSIMACINKFSNALNFRGEPYIPGKHKLLACN
ncbi:MAG: DUF2163 domain-containing protein [Rickettsiales bacterium]